MANSETITSAANPLLKEVKRAIARGERTRDGLCVAEGFHLLEEARRSGREVPVVLVAESRERDAGRPRSGKKVVLPDPLLRSVSGTENAQGVIALVRPPEWTLDDLFRGTALVVALDAVQDPGNAGTIARSAEAFGATGVLFLEGSVSPHNPKTLRASAGSLFRVPYVVGGSLEGRNATRYATVASGGRPVGEADFRRPCVVIVGSEAHGVRAELRAGATEVSIPTAGVESLNAAVAASIALYEAARQRRPR